MKYKIFIWGVGILARIYIENNYFTDNCEILGFIDNSKAHKLPPLSAPIYTPDEFVEADLEYDYIIIANKFSTEIKNQCEKLKFDLKRIVFVFNVYFNPEYTIINEEQNFNEVRNISLKLYDDMDNSFLNETTEEDKTFISFLSYDGKKYDDSPRVIYEKMLNDERFKCYEFLWGFIDPEKYDIPKGLKLNPFSLKYQYYNLKVKCCITNSSNGIGFEDKKDIIYFNTWHGIPIKKMGEDVGNAEFSGTVSTPDVMCAQGKYDAEILARLTRMNRCNVLITGLPRNDILVNHKNLKEGIIKKLLLPKDKKLILYCPTFRDVEISGSGYSIKPPLDFKKWEEKIGKDYIVLFRAHYNISEIYDVEFNNFVFNFSDYQCLNDLMIASDILVSDYSSVYFDYSIMGKPVLCFAYDYDKYVEYRGLYIDVRKDLPCEIAYEEDTLLQQILNLDYDKMEKQTIEFRDDYIESFGNATDICIDKIWDMIK